MDESGDPSPAERTPIKPRRIAIRRRRSTRDKLEIERSGVRRVLGFRRQEAFRLKELAPAAEQHRSDHRAPVSAQEKIGRNEREKRGYDKNEGKLSSEGDGDRVKPLTHVGERPGFLKGKPRMKFLVWPKLYKLTSDSALVPFQSFATYGRKETRGPKRLIRSASKAAADGRRDR